VEYLYQLVHHTLDILSSQDKKQVSQTKAQSKQQSNNAVAEDEAAFHDATTNFLPLDCHIKEVTRLSPRFGRTSQLLTFSVWLYLISSDLSLSLSLSL